MPKTCPPEITDASWRSSWHHSQRMIDEANKTIARHLERQADALAASINPPALSTIEQRIGVYAVQTICDYKCVSPKMLVRLSALPKDCTVDDVRKALPPGLRENRTAEYVLAMLTDAAYAASIDEAERQKHERRHTNP